MTWTEKGIDRLEWAYESACIHGQYARANRIWKAVRYLHERLNRG